MIDITDYIEYGEIRAVIGVDELELPDTTIDLPIYTARLFRALRAFTNSSNETLVEIYSRIMYNQSTAADEEMYSLIKEYSVYVVAEACCSGLSMFALKTDTDGKASQSRFASENTYRDVITNIREKLASLTGLLEEALSGQAQYALGGMTAVPPTTDRVTG